jgi:Short repeat of unknown function (DUF308)
MRRLVLQLSSGGLHARVAGALLMVLGACALSAPFAVGRWSLTLLGIPLIVLSLGEAYATFMSPRRARASAYLPSALAMLAGNLLLAASASVWPSGARLPRSARRRRGGEI